MANKLYDEAHIQDIADAIREKNGSSTTYKVSQMGAAVRAIEGSGGGQSGDGADLALSVLRGTISDLSPFSGLTSIREGAFMNCKSITSASFPACTNIGTNAFNGCRSLASASFPSCASIGSYAFNSCTSLRSASFPACTSIGSYAFASCTFLRSASLPVCTSISMYTFYNCQSLVSIHLPMCTGVGAYAFYSCTSLKLANLPACTMVNNAAFCRCSSLESVILSASRFSASAFTSCSRLVSLTNTYSSVATLSAASAFYSTPMSVSTYTDANGNVLGYGSIYVPASLVASYKTATNWATYAARITSIPE